MTLQFKRIYVPMILSGSKRQTLRTQLVAGSRVGESITFCNGYRAGSKFATARCCAIDDVRFSDLTDDDARLGGFDTLPALRTAIIATFGAGLTISKVWRYRWIALQPHTTTRSV